MWDGIAVWYAFGNAYVNDDVRFSSAESDTKAWLQACVDALPLSFVHGKLIWDGIVVWYAFENADANFDVRFGGAESDTKA